MRQYAKAWYAAAVAALTALGTALIPDAVGGAVQITAAEYVAVALAALVAGGGVAKITNAPAEG